MGKIIYNGELLGSTIAGDISIEPTDGISSTNVQDTIIEVDSKIVQTNNNLNTHTKNSTIHITENERTKWDGVDSINTKLGTTDISNIGSTITGAISSLATTIGVGNSISGNSLKEDIANLSNTLSSHTHDDRYYTESEIDEKLDTKANTSHGNHVPTVQTVDNATFLRNDNTWAKVTPENIGAQPAGSYALSDHTHDDRYYTETEINAKLDTKANTSHTHVSNDIKSLDASKLTGTIDIDRLPQGALDKLIKVANDAERFKLTTEDIQLGDSVKVLSTKKMYIVVDESKLSSEDGYEVYTADSATSVPWSGITDKPNSYTPSDHTHDDRYYTESEIDEKLDTKANTSHGNHVPTTQTADNATFLRNDNTWAKVTPENIGAQPAGSYAAASHKHTKIDITDFPTSMPASDVYSWAKAETKPSYSASEVGAAVNCALSNEDLNNITAPGYYNAGESNTVTNKPNGVDHFGLIVIHSDTGNYYTQKLFNNTTQYTRKCVNGTWGDWNEDKLTDTNTWRGIQDNLISSSTTDSLSANQGKILDTKKADLEDTVISKNYNAPTPASTTIAEFASHNKSYVGSVLLKDNNWYSLISARHRNLRDDGVNFGMIIYSPFTDDSLLYTKQYSGKWIESRTILDSDNFKNFVTTENVGYYGSDDANSNGWYKVFSDTLTGYIDRNAILLLSTGYGNHNSGLLRLRLRCNDTDGINIVQFNWIYRGGYTVNSAVIIIDGNTWSLYVYKSGQYGRIKVRVLESFATSGYWLMKIGSNFTKTDITFDSSINYTFPNDDYSIVGNANNIKLNATDNNHSYSLVMVGSTVTGDNYDSPRISSNLKYFESKDAGKDSLMGFDSLVGASCTVGDGYASAIGYQCQAQAQFSHAEGTNTTASGVGSHAEGVQTYASGECSHAEGDSSTACNNSHAEGADTYASDFAHAEGVGTSASGDIAHAEGYYTTASGYCSHAEGNSTYASTWYSHAEGNNTSAYGSCSHAEGYKTCASGANSHAEGYGTRASVDDAHAEGDSTSASNYASHACGKYNAAMTDGGTFNNTTGTAFVIGNGTSNTSRSNAFSVQYNGIVKAKSTITASTTADYAEFFEWKDGNSENEDRVGHFVTLDNDKILIATDPDQYILGIVSGEPFVLGNGDCDTWNGMYLKDEFNRTIYEPAPKMELDEETGEYKQVLDEDGNPIYEGTRPKINPDYDPSRTYISRFDRKEWAPVGMLGVLSVIQDGTCEVNGYACCNKDGIATKCNRTDPGAYRVIAKISNKVVRVIFR